MGTAKRERQKAGRQARLQQAQAVAAKRRRLRFTIISIALVGVVILALFALAPDDDDAVTASGSTTTSSSSVPGETVETVTITVPPLGEELTEPTPCPAADGSSARTTTFVDAPPTCIDPAKSYTAEVLTTEGPFTIQLDPVGAPITTNNFVVLARYHYYEGVAFHRIITGFMNQTGDALGPSPGQGGPGYSIPDELPTDDAAYVEGSVAMANAGANTGGSQWFVVVGDGGSQLTPDYSRFGSVISGIEVVRQINQFSDPASGSAGTPTQEVVIESITITES